MSHNSYQKCKVCQNDVQTNLTWTDIGHMHAGFVHTLSKKFCSTNTLTGIGHWHPEFVHSLSNNFLIPPEYHSFIGGQSVDKDWTLNKLWTYFKQGQTDLVQVCAIYCINWDAIRYTDAADAV